MAELDRLDNWTFKTKHVQAEDDLDKGWVSSESVVLVAGPPTADGIGTNTPIPVGVIESATIAQNKQLQQIFEIGSRKSWIIPGRTQVNIGISRILFSGDSIMSALTSKNGADGTDTETFPDAPGYETSAEDSGKYFLNLASSFFNKPFGLGIVFHDSDDDALAMVYLEECSIRSHQMSIGANQTILMENVNLMAANVVPIDYASNT